METTNPMHRARLPRTSTWLTLHQARTTSPSTQATTRDLARLRSRLATHQEDHPETRTSLQILWPARDRRRPHHPPQGRGHPRSGQLEATMPLMSLKKDVLRHDWQRQTWVGESTKCASRPQIPRSELGMLADRLDQLCQRAGSRHIQRHGTPWTSPNTDASARSTRSAH